MHDGEQRLLMKTEQADYLRQWLYAVDLTDKLLPLPSTDMMLTERELPFITEELFDDASMFKTTQKVRLFHFRAKNTRKRRHTRLLRGQTSGSEIQELRSQPKSGSLSWGRFAPSGRLASAPGVRSTSNLGNGTTTLSLSLAGHWQVCETVKTSAIKAIVSSITAPPALPIATGLG
jgi:hypothetical protein